MENLITPKRSLELFSGSKNISEVLKSHSFETWTIDWNAKLNPSICCDIINFNYQDCPDSFSLIWASPDCRCYSRSGKASNWEKEIIKYRQYRYSPKTIEASNALLLLFKTIEIIRHYSPVMWIIENPVGRMRHIPELKNFAPFRYGVNYKDYGFEYSKETDLFSNIYLPLPQKTAKRPGTGVASVNSRYKRSIVPAGLIEEILKSICL